MRIYIVEYKHLIDKEHGIWSSKVSQEGYSTLEDAQVHIESRPGSPVKCSEFYYQTATLDEYYIHDILIKE